ncbi:MAG: hypothetical protein R3C61_16450 [Bacteroidia bacterium]
MNDFSMSRLSTFEIHIDGRYKGTPLTPDAFDIKDWEETLKYARTLLFPDSPNKTRPHISFTQETGSIRFIFTTTIASIIQAHSLLAEVQKSKDLGILPEKQAESIRYFHRLAQHRQFEIKLGEQNKLDEGLLINQHTEFTIDKPAWVETETIVWGKVMNMGGKTNPNIHLETDDFGTIIIAATEEELAKQEQNRIYHQQQLQIRIRQNAFTGEYDTSNARLVAFIDYDYTESSEAYLERLIREATPGWAEVIDPENWLRELRGYEKR